MTIVRKATEKVVGRNVPDANVQLYLACLPTGVYSLENSDGVEIAVATVSRGKVRITPVVTAV